VNTKFVIIITLVVNETNTNTHAFNLLRFFVDLIGPGTPTDIDRTQVCQILQSALLKLDVRIQASALTCKLNDRLSLKRDASYVADLTYPNNNPSGLQNSASGLAASFVALAFGLAAALCF